MESRETTKSELGITTPPSNSQITTTSGNEAWREWVEPVMEVVAKIPDYIVQFFSDYRQPLITVGLFVLGIVSVKITLAVLDAIDDVPLLAPVLEIVGIGYTAWFVWRYLWRAENRRELLAEFEAIKTQIFGDRA
jgi:hypothetical protein